jgi:uncharacterized protein YbaR (Trm112 family)
MRRIEHILACLKCRRDLKFCENSFTCEACDQDYPVADGIPCYVPNEYWEFNDWFIASYV